MSQYNNPPTQGGPQQPNGTQQPVYQQNPYSQPNGYSQNPYQQAQANAYRQAPYGQPNPYQQAPSYVPPAAPVAQPVTNQMTLGNWMLTMLVLSIPLVGFIMLLVWAFGGHDQPSRRTYCQASLLWGVIVLVISILIILIFGVSLGAILSSMN